MNARWLGSPNFTPGRDGRTMKFVSPQQPSYLVLHTVVGTLEGADARFQQATQQVSAHYGVGLTGSLVQWVREEDAAWHAGDWPMNLSSIGIEHEDGGNYNGPRTPQLYATSVALVREICTRYGIPITRQWIRKHSEVSDNPTGCPDGLDIDRIVREAAGPGRPPAIPAPPAPPADPEWKRNLTPETQHFLLYRSISLVDMNTGDAVGTVSSGPLDTAYATKSAGVDYFVTEYSHSSDRPNGVRSADAQAAAQAPTPAPPPPPLPTTYDASDAAPVPPSGAPSDLPAGESAQASTPLEVVSTTTGGLPAAEAGYKTTEFWGKSVIQVFSVVFAIYVAAKPGRLTADQQAQIIGLAGIVIPATLEALYGFFRSWRKRGTPG